MNLPTSGLTGSMITPAEVGTELEPLLQRVEGELDALGKALVARDSPAIERHATELHRSLVRALDGFSQAARKGPVPGPLRVRLAQASGQVAFQRECLARATAALDRAIDAMLPREASGVYNAQGGNRLAGSTGSAVA